MGPQGPNESNRNGSKWDQKGPKGPNGSYWALKYKWIQIRAGKSKSLIRWKRLKGGKRRKKAEKANLIYN